MSQKEILHEQGIAFRDLPTNWKRFQSFLLALVSFLALVNIIRLPFYFGIQYYEQQFLSIFMGLLLCVTFLSIAPTRKKSQNHVPWYDQMLALFSLCLSGYLFYFYPSFTHSLTSVTPDKLFFASLAVILILEAVRRLFGWVLTIIPLAFITYMLIADKVPELLQGRAMPLDRGLIYLFLDPNGMLGIVLRMIATIVLVFIIFGHALIQLGAGKALTDFAFAIMGGWRGGAAKSSILMSSMFGSISGSPVANVTVTGAFTIPLMRKTGYPLNKAAAVESVASTGGLIMPPIMGATAFIMAEFLGRPYSEIVIAAIIPAILFYVSLFIQVDMESARYEIKGLSITEKPSISKNFKKMWVFFIPMGTLIFLMFGMDMRPTMAGMYTLAVIALLSWLIPKRRFGIKTVYEILVKSGKSILQIGVIGAAVGFIMGSVNITGLSMNLSRILLELGGGNLLLILLMTAVTSIILGMGMPSTPVYVTLAVLIAPALISAGIEPVAAHMFLFYYGILSFVTPPVAIASYAAAAVAQTNALHVGWAGMRFAGMLYILPWIFVFVPELLILDSQKLNVIYVLIACLMATLTTSFVLGGWMFGKLSTTQRIGMAAASINFWMATLYLSEKGPLTQIISYRPEIAAILVGVGILILVGVIISKKLTNEKSGRIGI